MKKFKGGRWYLALVLVFRPPWQDDLELEAIAAFFKANQKLPQVRREKSSITSEEKDLAQALHIILQARNGDVLMPHRNGTSSVKRAQLTTTEILRWEAVLGCDIWRQASQREEYVPGQDIFDVQCQTNTSDADYTCIRCGYGAATEVQILQHVVRSHPLPSYLETQTERFIGTLTCCLCSCKTTDQRAFASEEMLLTHVREAHTSIFESDGDGASLREAYVRVAAYLQNRLCGRHTFPRVPRAAPPLACYLCGYGGQSKNEMWVHLQEAHFYKGTPLSNTRLEEEYRKRLFYYEEFCGPYVVSGQEVRRSVSAHALHQTHCFQNGSDANFNRPPQRTSTKTRKLWCVCLQFLD